MKIDFQESWKRFDGMVARLFSNLRCPQYDIPFKATGSIRFNLQFFAPDADKTEEATPKRKADARKKGQVVKSTELNSVAVLMTLFLVMNAVGEWLYKNLSDYLRQMLSPSQINQELTEIGLRVIMFNQGLFFGKIFLPLGLGSLVIGLIMNYVQVGPLFTLETLTPKFNRINPLSGLQRLFSPKSLVELAKSILKLIVVGYFAYSTIKGKVGVLIQTVNQSPLNAAFSIWSIIYQVALKICAFLLIMAIFDYAYQRYEHKKSLRMSKKEVKDEFKQHEGNPQIKSKIRQRQRQLATRRMMQDVPKADVVITNPTHFAVALRYDAETMAAPVVVAKGEGYIAAKIKEIAALHEVTVVENKPLAQALFKTVEIGEAIPTKLFQAVAEVLAFVYRLRQSKASF